MARRVRAGQTRRSIAIALIAALLGVGCAALLDFLAVRRDRAADLQRIESEIESKAAAVVERRRRALTEDGRRLAEALMRQQPLAPQSPGPINGIGWRLSDAQWWEIADPDQTVVAAWPGPTRLGLSPSVPATGPSVELVPLHRPEGEQVEWVVRVALAEWGSGYVLLLGRSLALDELGSAGAALIRGPAGIAGLPIESAGSDLVAGCDASQLATQPLAVPAALEPLGAFEWGPDPCAEDLAFRAWRRRSLHAMWIASIPAILLGWWHGRRSAAPLGEALAAVDAVSKGDADYTFSRVVEDEYQELVTAFSGLNRALERQRQRARSAERVAAWREVARRVAHEVKNPLAPIRLSVENLQRARRVAPEQFDQMLDSSSTTILEEVDRLSRLVSEFSSFARLPAPQPRPVDLAAACREALELHARGIAQNYRERGTAQPILADPDQLQQVLSNLIGNAVDAQTGKADARVGIDATFDRGRVLIRLTDNGPGWSQQALERGLEPYFTTKQDGTGLGLAIVQRIVGDHGASIELLAAESGGAEVRLGWPLAEANTAGEAGR